MAGGPPQMGNRNRIKGKRQVGQLVQWRGKYGWIVPNEPINHPEAAKHKGKVYVGIEDVDGPELNNKCTVSFLLYSDGGGLGAMHCRREEGKEGKGIGKRPPDGGKGKAIRSNPWVKKAAGMPPWRPMALSGSKPQQPKAKVKAKAKIAAKPKAKTLVKEEPKPNAESGELPDVDLGPPPPDVTARVPVTTTRVVGKLIRWRGTVGWIKPLEKIDYQDAKKHKRGIYLHEIDVDPGQEMFQGAQVSFTVYADDDGLGAENCQVTPDQPVQEEERPEKAAQSSKKPKLAATAKAKPGLVQSKFNRKFTQSVQEGRRRQRRRQESDKGKGKGKGAAPAKAEKTEPSGPDLPRERVTDIPISGEVVSWRGKFGWLKPAEPVEHELSSKHEGKIYCHQKDLVDGEKLVNGQSVEFHVYADSTGLGAEDVITT